MNVSIIVVNYNGYEHTRNALRSIVSYSPGLEVIVVDNHSEGDDLGLLQREFPSFTYERLSENRGFGSANNAGAKLASGRYLFFLNNDTVLSSDAPALLGSFLEERPNVAAVGPRLLNPDGTLQMSFGFDPSLRNEWKVKELQRLSKENPSEFQYRMRPYLQSPCEVDWLTGAALMVRRSVFEDIGGFDESFFMYFEDADLCRRIRLKGWKVLHNPSVSIVHVRGASISTVAERIKVEYRRSQLRYYAKHHSRLSTILLRIYLLAVFGARRLVFYFLSTPDASSTEAIIRLALRLNR